MFSKILVPLDGSVHAACAVPRAIELAKAYGSKIVLARVLERPAEDVRRPVSLLDWEIDKRQAHAYLEDICKTITAQGLDCLDVILEGKAAQRLLEFVEAEDFDLIVASSHGKSGDNFWNLGSVIRKIVQCAFRSILIVRACEQEGAGFKRIFVPLDGSQRAEFAFNAATLLARGLSASVFIGSAVSQPEMPFPIELTQEDKALAKSFASQAEQRMKRYVEALCARDPERISARVEITDSIAETLHAMVRQENADLVVLCAHGYSGKKVMPFGAVTTMFIEYGTTPLLIVQDLNPADMAQPEAAPNAR